MEYKLEPNPSYPLSSRPRPSYKSRAELWRSLFWCAVIALTITGAALGWTIHGNMTLQAENAEMEAFCNKNVTAVVK